MSAKGSTAIIAIKAAGLLVAMTTTLVGVVAAHFKAKEDMRDYTDRKVIQLQTEVEPKLDRILTLIIEQGKDVEKIKGAIGQ